MSFDNMKLSETWSTHRAAECLGISDNTLKNWHDRGLLAACDVSVSRTITGHRKFNPGEIQHLAERMKRQEIRIVDGQLHIRTQQAPQQSSRQGGIE